MNKQNTSPLASGVDRRTAIKQLALACGLALSAQSLSLLAASFSFPKDMSRRTQTALDPQQLALVRQLGEIIIPTTDTPGAIAAGVHDFINHQLVYCFGENERTQILGGLTRIQAIAQSRHEQNFLTCEPEQQIALLQDMEAAREEFSAEDRHAFKQLKALVAFGYYTSEIGATRELAYLPVPGGYRPIKFSEIGKAWALN
jgi:hypothetical protein